MSTPAEHDVPPRIVTRQSVAAFFVLTTAWSLYLRVRHISARFRVPDHFVVYRVFPGMVGLALDILTYIGIVIITLGLFGSTRDRVERVGIATCFASVLTNPLKMLFPNYAAEIWWFNLGCLLVFFLASVAVLVNLHEHASGELIEAGEDRSSK